MNNLLRKLAGFEGDNTNEVQKSEYKKKDQETNTNTKNPMFNYLVIGGVIIFSIVLNLLFGTSKNDNQNLLLNSSDVCVNECSGENDFNSCLEDCNKRQSDEKYDCYDKYCEDKCFDLYKESDEKFMDCYSDCLIDCSLSNELDCNKLCN